MVWLDPLKLRMHSFCSPVFHCYACPLATFACPIGIIAQFSALHLFPFMVVGLLLLLGSLLGAGNLWLALPLRTPARPDRPHPHTQVKNPRVAGRGTLCHAGRHGHPHPLSLGRGTPPIRPVRSVRLAVWKRPCPTWSPRRPKVNPFPGPTPSSSGIIVTFLIAIVFTVRPWCRILCPLGAIYGLCNRFSVLRLDLKEHQCTDCKRCRTLCDYGIQPDQTPNSDQCLRCLECTQCGPGALQTSHLFASQETTKNQENT